MKRLQKQLRKLKAWLPQTKRQRFIYLVALLFVLSLVAIAGLRFFRAGRAGNSQTVAEVIRYSVDTPSETKPTDTYRWKGGPQDPKKIVIPALGIDHFIQNVGVDQNQQVTAPNNIHIAGWFVDSVRPGERGLSIIDGHLSGRSQEGIFMNLPQIKTGHDVVLVMGGGQRFTYKVFDTKTVPHEQAATALFEQSPTVSSQLNLITCTGRFDTKSNTYADRIIVYAELQN